MIKIFQTPPQQQQAIHMCGVCNSDMWLLLFVLLMVVSVTQYERALCVVVVRWEDVGGQVASLNEHLFGAISQLN